MIKFDIITVLPDSFEYLNHSIIKRAADAKKIDIHIHDLRRWTTDKRRTVDDKPFSGGAGMLIKIEPIYKALKELGVYPSRDPKTKVYLTSAKGIKWNQTIAQNSSQDLERIVIICGRYEGIDHRVVEHLIDSEVSVGEYILSGGELASMILVDSITRLIPGVLGNEESLIEETSFNEDHTLFEYPQYTRPAVFKTDEGEEWGIPEILLSGDHAEVKKWKAENRK